MIDSIDPRAARILKSLFLPGNAVSPISTRFHLACLILLAILFSARPVAAGNRVVAWGDIQYDLTLSWPTPADSTTSIAAGDFHSLALDASGTVSAWGDDRFNQTNLSPGLSSGSVSAIAAGNIHNLALLTDGTVAAWGPAPGQSGDYGQCTVPPGLHDVIAISAGAVHSLALKRDGTLTAWAPISTGSAAYPLASAT